MVVALSAMVYDYKTDPQTIAAQLDDQDRAMLFALANDPDETIRGYAQEVVKLLGL